MQHPICLLKLNLFQQYTIHPLWYYSDFYISHYFILSWFDMFSNSYLEKFPTLSLCLEINLKILFDIIFHTEYILVFQFCTYHTRLTPCLSEKLRFLTISFHSTSHVEMMQINILKWYKLWFIRFGRLLSKENEDNKTLKHVQDKFFSFHLTTIV